MGLERFLNYGKNIGLSLLVIGMLGCNKGDKSVNPTNGNNEDEVKQKIVNVYQRWARMSRSHDYNGMIGLVAPGSNMAGATEVCKQEWDDEREFYYNFSLVEVEYTTESPPDAWIRGNYTSFQGGSAEPYNGGFYGGAIPIDGDYYGDNWKLNQMNWDKEPNWWR